MSREPGLWAVVKDKDGTFWVRIDEIVWRRDVDGYGCTWDEIDSPALVREGVPA